MRISEIVGRPIEPKFVAAGHREMAAAVRFLARADREARQNKLMADSRADTAEALAYARRSLAVLERMAERRNGGRRPAA